MAIIINGLNMDAGYARALEANQYYGGIFVPGVTFTDKYSKDAAGTIKVHKISTQAAAPSAPGEDFSDEAITDELITINLNNAFRKSKKVYNVQAAQMSADIKDAALSTAQGECREGWTVAGCACLVKEATASADTTAPTEENAKSLVLKARAEIVGRKGVADVVVCSPSFYNLVLMSAGKDFQPVKNDKIADDGKIGRYLGMIWVEAAALAAASGSYYDHADTLQNVDFSGVDFVIYNHEALSILDSFVVARVIDSERFAGVLAQYEANTGYRVTNSDLAVVHRHAAG